MPDISKRLEKAERYLQKSKPEAALDEYLGILEEDAGNEQVRQAAADLCLALGRDREASALLSYLFEAEVAAGDGVKGITTYKKLAKVVTPTALQTFHFAQFVEKRDKKEALEAYETALKGFDAQHRPKEALAAAKRIVDLVPTAKNLRRAGEKAASLGESKAAALYFGQLGVLKDTESAGTGFEWFERAYHLDPQNLHLALPYARGFFARNAFPECIAVLTPAVAERGSSPELHDLLVRALVACKQPSSAEPYAWALFENDPKRLDEMCSLVGAYLDGGFTAKALALVQKLDQHETRAGRQRDFISRLHEVSEKATPAIEFLEYLVRLFNATNREQEYCGTLGKLFQLYYASGDYAKAGEALDRVVEVDPYEPGQRQKLAMLRGKIDPNLYNSIANRFQSGAATEEPLPPSNVSTPSDPHDPQPTVLEDIILQAEIYLQYGMRAKALERLERVSRLFPGEEGKNQKLRELYITAGMVPKQSAPSSPPAKAARPANPPKNTPAASPPPPPEVAAVDDFARVTEITRNIHRQVNVKSVLFSAVNEIGRHFGASRCVAGLCTPGKPPSAALEYCAPGVTQSEVLAIVKLIGVVQQLAVNGAVSIADVRKVGAFEAMREHIAALKIESLLAMPLIDAGEQSGILILQQCTPRQWRQADIVVLKTLAEQVVLGVSNARLRSLMKSLAVTEEKSGLLKRSSYLDVFLSEVRRAVQQQTPLTVLLFHFGKASALSKEVGESQVENMMQQAGQTICSHVRQNDVALRYDLTTIALLLSDTGEKNGFLVVEKMKKVLASIQVPGTDRMPVLSVGLAETALQPKFDPVDIVTEAINRVEAALEMARADGSNKTRALRPSLEPNPVA
ncbi:MAG TPA: GAF domain-containing protein [Verrucomicrobiae bacterium]|jgi:GGDEF domain-containing protein/tetratricopeptide (TPR) repeat protein|nr:GAF domain-containing protein [Verrucomicrobiae bacterium]